MARITVEDCLTKETNRFALVLLAAKRTKQILRGAKVLTPSDNKSVVTALREIAEGQVRFMNEAEAAEAREKGLVDDGSALPEGSAHSGFSGAAGSHSRTAEGHSSNGGSSPGYGAASKIADPFAAAFENNDRKVGADADEVSSRPSPIDDDDNVDDDDDDVIEESDDDDSDDADEAGKASTSDDD